MRKVLLATTLAGAMSTSALASENEFFLGGDLGGAFIGKIKEKSALMDNKKSKRGKAFVVSALAGYHLSDSARAFLSYSFYNSAKLKSKKDATNYLDHKLSISTLKVNGTVDVMDFGFGKANVTAGVGVAMLKDRITGKLSAANAINTIDEKAKSKKGFTWSVGFGGAFELSDGVNLNLAYSFNQLGKTKSAVKKINNVDQELSKLSLKSHNVSARLEVSL